jgi:hypothetical protein
LTLQFPESRAASVDRDSEYIPTPPAIPTTRLTPLAIYVDDSDGDGDHEDLALNPFFVGFTDNLNEQRVFLDQLSGESLHSLSELSCLFASAPGLTHRERIEMLIAEIHRLQGTAAVSLSPDLDSPTTLTEEPTQGK